jgi:hypothetical protein
MAGITKRSFDSADEVRSPDKTKLEIVDLGGTKAARMTAQPGWRWSECIKPIVGTDSCQLRHVGMVRNGRMRVTHEDGTVLELGRGDVYVIEPGHDAEIVSDEPFEAFEFEPHAAEEYART